MIKEEITDIKNSYDCKYCRYNIIILSAFIILFTLLCFILNDLMIINFIVISIAIILLVKEFIVYICILKNYDKYQIIETSFNEFHFYIRKAYFVIKFEYNGKLIEINTRLMFNSLVYSERNVELFVGKKVLIGYNSLKNKVIVLKVIN